MDDGESENHDNLESQNEKVPSSPNDADTVTIEPMGVSTMMTQSESVMVTCLPVDDMTELQRLLDKPQWTVPSNHNQQWRRILDAQMIMINNGFRL
jgi:hypothetical protein